MTPGIAIEPASPTTVDDLTLVLDESLEAGEEAPAYVIEWSLDGTVVESQADALTVSAAETARDQVWSVVVYADNGKKVGETQTASVTINNTPPSGASASLSPDDPRTNDALTASATADDVDADRVAWTWEWRVNGQVQTETGPTLYETAFAKGDVVEVSATPTDGFEDGAPATASVTINNTPPTYDTVSISPGQDVTVESLLACVAEGFSDADGDANQSLFIWARNGASVGDGPVFAVEGSQVGDEIVCIVVPFDGEDQGPRLASDPVVVEAIDAEPCSVEPTYPTDPYIGEDFDPDRITPSGSFAVDASLNVARHWCDGDVRVRPSIDLLIQTAQFPITNNLQEVCSVKLFPTDPTVPLQPHSFEHDPGTGARTFEAQGFVLESGSFEVVDAPFEVSAGTVGGCLSRNLDPTAWSDDLETLLTNQDWGLYIGEVEDQVEAFLTDLASDDPTDPEDIYSLYQDGYITGASNTAGPDGDTNPYLISFAFEVDETDWTAAVDEDDENVRLLMATAAPDGRDLGQGLFVVRAYGYWNARFVLDEGARPTRPLEASVRRREQLAALPDQGRQLVGRQLALIVVVVFPPFLLHQDAARAAALLHREDQLLGVEDRHIRKVQVLSQEHHVGPLAGEHHVARATAAELLGEAQPHHFLQAGVSAVRKHPGGEHLLGTVGGPVLGDLQIDVLGRDHLPIHCAGHLDADELGSVEHRGPPQADDERRLPLGGGQPGEHAAPQPGVLLTRSHPDPRPFQPEQGEVGPDLERLHLRADGQYRHHLGLGRRRSPQVDLVDEGDLGAPLSRLFARLDRRFRLGFDGGSTDGGSRVRRGLGGRIGRDRGRSEARTRQRNRQEQGRHPNGDQMLHGPSLPHAATKNARHRPMPRALKPMTGPPEAPIGGDSDNPLLN